MGWGTASVCGCAGRQSAVAWSSVVIPWAPDACGRRLVDPNCKAVPYGMPSVGQAPGMCAEGGQCDVHSEEESIAGGSGGSQAVCSQTKQCAGCPADALAKLASPPFCSALCTRFVAQRSLCVALGPRQHRTMCSATPLLGVSDPFAVLDPGGGGRARSSYANPPPPSPSSPPTAPPSFDRGVGRIGTGCSRPPVAGLKEPPFSTLLLRPAPVGRTPLMYVPATKAEWASPAKGSWDC